MKYIKFYIFELPLYNLFIGIGIAVGMVVLEKRFKNIKITIKKLNKIYIILASSLSIAFGGAFFFDALVHDIEFTFTNITQNHIGLTFYGGLLFGVIIFSVPLKVLGLDLMNTINIVIPSLVIGHAFGRIGCFFGGCCYGKIVSLFFYTFQFPTQLCESLFLFILYFFLIKKINMNHYLIVYLFSYGIWRFLIEFFRGDVRGELFNQNLLSPSQIISIIMIISSVFIRVRLKKSKVEKMYA